MRPKVSDFLPSFVLHEIHPRILDLSRRMKQAGLTTSLDTNDGPGDRRAEDLLDTLKKVVFFFDDYKVRRVARTKDLHLVMANLCHRIPVLAVRMCSEGATAQRGGERARGSNGATTPPGQGQPYHALEFEDPVSYGQSPAGRLPSEDRSCMLSLSAKIENGNSD